MAHLLGIDLRPTDWVQGVEHHGDTGVEGRRFIANCKVRALSELELSNGLRLENLRAQMQIFETSRMQHQLSTLPKDILGAFKFYGAQDADAEFPAEDAFLAGWFVLHSQSLQAAWDQVRQGGYTDCDIRITVGPVEDTLEAGCLWNVEKTPQLTIDSVSISFARSAPTRTA